MRDVVKLAVVLRRQRFEIENASVLQGESQVMTTRPPYRHRTLPIQEWNVPIPAHCAVP